MVKFKSSLLSSIKWNLWYVAVRGERDERWEADSKDGPGNTGSIRQTLFCMDCTRGSGDLTACTQVQRNNSWHSQN